jgi:hypothetical protein
VIKAELPHPPGPSLPRLSTSRSRPTVLVVSYVTVSALRVVRFGLPGGAAAGSQAGSQAAADAGPRFASRESGVEGAGRELLLDEVLADFAARRHVQALPR